MIGSEDGSSLRSGTRVAARAGRWAGPLLAVALYVLLPDAYRAADGASVAFSAAGRATLALTAWMAVWWVTEALEVYATALLPLVVLPLAGAATMSEAAAPYANESIFLFMGGFVLALGMQRHGLDHRIALIVVRIVGTSPRRMVLGFMIATAAISGFVSNTATAAMMLPVGLGAITLVEAPGRGAPDEARRGNFARCLMLGIAYAASIGGVATLVGTPPNAFLAGYLRDSIDPAYRLELGFARWMLIGVPLAAVFLPLAWWLLVGALHPVRAHAIPGAHQHVAEAHRALGRPSQGEWTVLLVFCVTAAAWMLRPVLAGGWHGAAIRVPPLAPSLTDAGIAMLAALTLFVLPTGGGRRAMDWATARQLPWGVLLLFGGGLSLAAAITDNGVAQFLGAQATGLDHLPPVALVLAVTSAVIFFSEIASNTATAAALVPILAATAPGLGVHPYLLIVPATLAASYAFMLPVGTPPNAIVFATGRVELRHMVRSGLWLNLLAIALITALALALVEPVLMPR